jgi:VanZ family protein
VTKKNILKTLQNYWLSFAWAGVIAFLSLTAGSNLPKLDWDLLSPDKFGHFTVYGLLSFLLLRDYSKGNGKETVAFLKQPSLYVWFAATAFGFLMEWSQYLFTPDRCFEYPDMLANAFGAALGAVVFYWSNRLKKMK